MSRITITQEEGNQMLREICGYAVRGLCEPDARVKQFYLERILLSLGVSLRSVRDMMVKDLDTEIVIGVNPDA